VRFGNTELEQICKKNIQNYYKALQEKKSAEIKQIAIGASIGFVLLILVIIFH
jgi:hypothetical protein